MTDIAEAIATAPQPPVPPSLSDLCKQSIAEQLGYNPQQPQTWPMGLVATLQQRAVNAGVLELHIALSERQRYV